jgi:leucyl-tRNA synthetase
MVIRKSLKEDDVKNLAMEEDNVKNYLNENTIKKIIFIKDKLINFVI